MTKNTTVTCIESRDLFRVEEVLRRTARRESDFSRGVQFANGSLLTQRERFAHEEACPACLAAEKAVS